MQLDTWDMLLNIFFMLFWFGIWANRSREILFNPFLAPISRWSQTAVSYVRGVFFGLNERTICVFVLIFLLVFRAVVLTTAGSWSLAFGLIRVQAPQQSYLLSVLFSVLSFAVMLFHLWSVSLFFVHSRKQAAFDNSRGALYWLSRPFSDIRIELRPAVLIVAGMLVAMGLIATGHTPGPNIVAANGGMLALVLRAFMISLAGWISVFSILRTALIVLIIGSWVAMFTGTHALMLFCHEWTGTLMGPLRRYPLRIGMLDLTPIVMIVALNFIHKMLTYIVMRSYINLFA